MYYIAERLMRQQLPSVTVTKEDATLSTSDVFGVPVAPPIIIHTAATPLATPPNWSPSPLNRGGGDVNLARNLSTTSTMSQSSSSMDATSINPDVRDVSLSLRRYINCVMYSFSGAPQHGVWLSTKGSSVHIPIRVYAYRKTFRDFCLACTP